jgi:selenocysteine lyase/cysteine desulfurase
VVMGRGERLALACIAPHSERLSADHLALSLSDGFQVMARSGMFCAQPAFEAMGLPQGAVRLSAYLYNTVDDVHTACRALHTLCSRLLG